MKNRHGAARQCSPIQGRWWWIRGLIQGENLAVFFGLSATGKTTLSTDEERPMLGDDEHGWGEEGVFNFEGGSYAKVIRLSEEDEPRIYKATNQFGTIIENVVLDERTRRVDYEDESKTENTRSSYPLTHLGNIVPEGKGPHPSHIVFLSADAFSVLPPIARLTAEQAMYYFICEQSSGKQYRFGMPGPEVEEKEWRRCLEALAGLKPGLDYIVASGSLAPGMPDDFYARVAEVAHEINARLVVDTSKDALRCAVEAGVFLIKPNLKEFQDLVGEELKGEER